MLVKSEVLSQLLLAEVAGFSRQKVKLQPTNNPYGIGALMVRINDNSTYPALYGMAAEAKGGNCVILAENIQPSTEVQVVEAIITTATVNFDYIIREGDFTTYSTAVQELQKSNIYVVDPNNYRI